MQNYEQQKIGKNLKQALKISFNWSKILLLVLLFYMLLSEIKLG